MAPPGGGNTSIIGRLQAENAQLKQILAQKDMVMHQRAEPALCELIDCLNTLTKMATAGHAPAVRLLQQWKEAVANAEAAAGSLLVVRNGTG